MMNTENESAYKPGLSSLDFRIICAPGSAVPATFNRLALVVPAADHPLFSTASDGLDSATPGGQRFHTWTGAVSEPCRAWARYSERRMIDTFSPAPASPAGMTYEKLWRV